MFCGIGAWKLQLRFQSVYFTDFRDWLATGIQNNGSTGILCYIAWHNAMIKTLKRKKYRGPTKKSRKFFAAFDFFLLWDMLGFRNASGRLKISPVCIAGNE